MTDATAPPEEATRVAWRRAKAEADRLYYKLNRDRVSAKRRERYKRDPLYRARVLAQNSKSAAAKNAGAEEQPQPQDKS